MTVLEKVELWLVLPIWLAAVVLAARDVILDRSQAPPVFVRLQLAFPESPDSYPRILGSVGVVFSSPDAVPVSGDRLVRFADVDVRGLGPAAVFARTRRSFGNGQAVRIVYEHGNELREVTARFGDVAKFGHGLILVAWIAGMLGVLIRLRAPPTRQRGAFFLTAITWSLFVVSYAGTAVAQAYAYLAVSTAANLAFSPLYLRAALLTPEEAAPTSRWPYIAVCVAVAGELMGSLWLVAPELLPFSFANTATFALFALTNLVALGLVVRGYLHAGPIGRRQVRWLLLGWGIALPMTVAWQVLVAVDPLRSLELGWLILGMAAVPVAYAIAIIRFNFLDIDRLISASAAYGLILFAALAALLAGVPRLAAVTSAAVGVDASTAQTILAIALAAVIVPAQRVVRPWMDRIFHRERVALEHGLATLLATLAACDAPERLFVRMGEGLDALLQPDTCVLYGRGSNGYAPVFARGRAVPPAFEPGSKLVVALSDRTRALAREQWRGRGAGSLDPFDRAALETLGAEVVVPIRHRERLSAFACLGTKRSGDVYTSTDLAFLSAVAVALARELDRFDEAEVMRQRQAMQQALRRFVPGAIAARLERGQDLGPAEREVVVLFVDLRGYTGYADGRPARDVFGTVNRYTEEVTRTVLRHGGSVVEFNGDGMMAVFGAPDPLPLKERAALETARDIVTGVRALALGDATPLEVGAGLATGPAFVGSIHAADREIWSAIGSTTNLAARLQALTRELGACIAIDARTFAAVGAAAADFVAHPGIPIRGRAEPEDVYVLPLFAAGR